MVTVSDYVAIYHKYRCCVIVYELFMSHEHKTELPVYMCTRVPMQ